MIRYGQTLFEKTSVWQPSQVIKSKDSRRQKLRLKMSFYRQHGSSTNSTSKQVHVYKSIIHLNELCTSRTIAFYVESNLRRAAKRLDLLEARWQCSHAFSPHLINLLTYCHRLLKKQRQNMFRLRKTKMCAFSNVLTFIIWRKSDSGEQLLLDTEFSISNVNAY